MEIPIIGRVFGDLAFLESWRFGVLAFWSPGVLESWRFDGGLKARPMSN